MRSKGLNRKAKGLNIVLSFAFSVLIFCSRPKERVGVIPSVAVTMVKKERVVRNGVFFGTISGEKQVTVLPKISGRVTEISKGEGSLVKEGEVLLYVLNDIPGMDYKPGPVSSPISGVVGKLYVEVGQTVGPTTPVATVADYSKRVKVKAPVSDKDLPFVKRGAKAILTLSSYPDTSFLGEVSSVSPILDPILRTATIEVTLPNGGGKLIPGMAGSVRLILEEKRDVLALPRSALFLEATPSVFVIEGEVAKRRPVKIGLVGDELIEILSGLKEGEKVITTGKERVKENQKVRVVEER